LIELNVDLSFLSKYFELSTSRVNSYSTKTIEEIMKLEEQNGNTQVSEFAGILQNPNKVVELFRLMDPENRYMIIKNLSSEDLNKLLPYLKKDDLVWGLKYFTKDKLMELIQQLPKQELFSVVFQNFTLEDIVKLMPTDELNEFLNNDKIEKNDIMKYFNQLEFKDLMRLFSEYFGDEFLTQDENAENRTMMLQTIQNLSPQDFNKFIMNMQVEDKGSLILNLVENKPELLMEFQNKSIARPMMLLEKAEILKSLNVLENELLIKMVEHLPEDLIQVVASQIDPEVFATILVDKFSDILKQISF